MNKLIIVLIWMLPLSIFAQRQAEYNLRGDEAMERKDYRDAKMWYEEGVSYCNTYSIRQLVKIWQFDESMRMSMRTVMNKCLNCLTDRALAKDTVAINDLILFYSEGIGTEKNEISANQWKNQLEQIRQPYTAVATPTLPNPKEKMKFLIGYHASTLTPFGIQVGAVNNKLGWYLRLHSDLSFRSHTGLVVYNDDNQEEIKDVQYEFAEVDTAIRKQNAALMGSAGVIINTFSDTYISVGVGYWQRDLLRRCYILDDEGNKLSEFLAKDQKKSAKGLLVDLNAIALLGKHFYGTAGCSILFGADKIKAYPNIGIGIYF